MRKTKWIYQESEHYSPPKHVQMDSTIYSLLQQRNLSYESVFSSNPFSLQDMEKAVQLLETAKEKKESIWIYGDYDVDGITSVSLCYLALQELGYTVEYYIPLRDEGYGLNKEALQQIYNLGGRTVVSVDCGISSIEEVSFASNLGITMIITDHHEIQQNIPKAAAVINPKRKDNAYDFPFLAGVGTAFFLVTALFFHYKKQKDLEKYLDIVAIGTIADIVPLVHDNRLLVKQGLPLLAKSQWTGLRILVKRLFPDYETRIFSAYDIGFVLAPVFNAAGRLEDAKNSVKLFLENDVKEANVRIDALLKNNTERRKVQENIFQSSLEEIQKKKLQERNAILVASEDFHHGVIGIVASKLVDRFYKPSIVMEIKKKEGIATASCRSISGINMIEALDSISHLLLRYGGHSGAAGFSIAIENIPIFYEELDRYLAPLCTEELLSKKIAIVKELLPLQIQYPLLRDMFYLEPFGASNPVPIFSMTGCRLDKLRLIGAEKKHLMCNIHHTSTVFWNCVWFQAADMFEFLLQEKKVDVAFHLKLEKYRGRYQYKIFIDDIKPSSLQEPKFHKKELAFAQVNFPYECILYLKHANLSDNLHLNFEESEVRLFSKKSYVATLDTQSSELLRYKKEEKNTTFLVSKKEIFLEEEHYTIHLKIEEENRFSSLALKEGAFFQDVKNFLLNKEGKYNSIQGRALSSFFKEKRNTLVHMERGRGMQTIIKTLSLYGDFFHKKYQVIDSYDGSQNIETDLDFILLLTPKILPKKKILTLALSEEKLKNRGYHLLEDTYSIPKNVCWIEEKDLTKYETVFSHKLSQKEQTEILCHLENYSKIYSTKDLLVHL